MSAQHTPGRLKAKQTDLMLEAGRFRMASRITACGSSAGLSDEIAVAQANARRLAACWNACEGVRTEILELAGTRQDWCDLMQELEQERNTLLAALEKIIAMNRQWAKDQWGDEAKAENMDCVKAARAAIASIQKSR